MNRRQIVMLSGAAVAAGQGLAQGRTAALSRSGARQGASAKALVKLNRVKSSYKVPKSESKKSKHLDKLTGALALTADQQQQAADLFTNARTATAALRQTLKTTRKGLSQAVKNNDTAAVRQLSAAMGNLRAQIIFAGANANAAFYAMLNPDQLDKLAQFRS